MANAEVEAVMGPRSCNALQPPSPAAAAATWLLPLLALVRAGHQLATATATAAAAPAGPSCCSCMGCRGAINDPPTPSPGPSGETGGGEPSAALLRPRCLAASPPPTPSHPCTRPLCKTPACIASMTWAAMSWEGPVAKHEGCHEGPTPDPDPAPASATAPAPAASPSPCTRA